MIRYSSYEVQQKAYLAGCCLAYKMQCYWQAKEDGDYELADSLMADSLKTYTLIKALEGWKPVIKNGATQETVVKIISGSFTFPFFSGELLANGVNLLGDSPVYLYSGTDSDAFYAIVNASKNSLKTNDDEVQVQVSFNGIDELLFVISYSKTPTFSVDDFLPSFVAEVITSDPVPIENASYPCLTNEQVSSIIGELEKICGCNLNSISDFTSAFEESYGEAAGPVANCSPAYLLVNGASIGDTGFIVSGGGLDLKVNRDGVPSGVWNEDTKSFDVTSSCADATVQLNGIEVGTIASGSSDSFPVTQDGSPVGSWNGSAWIVPSCPAGGSISVSVSNTSPSIGDTVTITATPSDFTPDNYYFVIDNGTDVATLIADQSGNSYNWTIPTLSTGNYTIYVFGVENGTPDVVGGGSVEVTISSNFLLDTPEGTGANFAFAFFRLRAGYTGAAALIRRSSDNVQESFFFDSNGVLSLSSEDGTGVTLGDWIGANDGYLVTGYSQDTAGVTFTASNAADQQRIIIGGALVEINDAVAMVGSNDAYVISTSLTVNSAFVVAENDGYNTVNSVIGSDIQSMNFGGGFSTVTGIGMFDSVGGSVQTSVEDLNPHLASYLVDFGIYVDGNLEQLGTINDPTITRVAGREDLPTGGMNGKIACIVTYATNKTSDRAAIEANINSNFTPSLLP